MKQYKNKKYTIPINWAKIGGATALITLVITILIFGYTYFSDKKHNDAELRRELPDTSFSKDVYYDSRSDKVVASGKSNNPINTGNIGISRLESISQDSEGNELLSEVKEGTGGTSFEVYIDYQHALTDKGTMNLKHIHNTYGNEIEGDTIDIQLPIFNNLRFIGVDASFIDDNINLIEVGRRFEGASATFYETQSAGSRQGYGALRIDGNILPDRTNRPNKKILYMFYNEDTVNSVAKERIESILRSSYTHLEHVEIMSYYELSSFLDKHTEDDGNDVRKVIGAIGDCNISPHTGCDVDFENYDNRSVNPLFSVKMIEANGIDVFFIVPAVLSTPRGSDGITNSK